MIYVNADKNCFFFLYCLFSKKSNPMIARLTDLLVYCLEFKIALVSKNCVFPNNVNNNQI